MAHQEGPRRRRVRELKAQGLTPREIALVLGISTQATYKHLRKIQAADHASTEQPIEQGVS